MNQIDYFNLLKSAIEVTLVFSLDYVYTLQFVHAPSVALSPGKGLED